MSLTLERITVDSAQSMELMITQYLAEGFHLANKIDKTAIMQKKKQHSVFWLLVGLLTIWGIFPLLIYFIVYACQPSVKIVEIVVSP